MSSVELRSVDGSSSLSVKQSPLLHVNHKEMYLGREKTVEIYVQKTPSFYNRKRF